MERRNFIKRLGLSSIIPFAISTNAMSLSRLAESSHIDEKYPKLTISGIKVYVVRVNARGNWYFIELQTNKGVSGFGEASHGIGNDGENALSAEIAVLYEYIKGESPLNIAQFRQRAWNRATQGKIQATAFSGIEQALWDLKGKALGVPVYDLLGGKLRDKIKVYANINRANNDKEDSGRRSVANFQRNAEEAVKNGFRAVKLAPFDEMKPLPSNPQQIAADIDYAVNTIETIRQTIGPEIDLLIDVHSHLNCQLAIETANRIQSSGLFWFEEPVNPGKFPEDTKAIKDSIKQTLAGGESIFGIKGFAPLVNNNAVGIIMPDVKNCGGVEELKNIATFADSAGGILVAPHNPSGPISTAVSVQVCASIPNFAILEYAYGEVTWRSQIITPEEQFVDGYIVLNNKPGLGTNLNKNIIKQHI